MAAPKGTLVPRVEGSAEVYGKRLNNRARALLDCVFDLMEDERRSGTFDPVAALRRAYEKDPLGYIERVMKMTPEGAATTGPAAALMANIGAMYLQVMQAPVAPVVDVTPEPSGYIEGTVVDKPLITQGDW
jgi:hypothetical protein